MTLKPSVGPALGLLLQVITVALLITLLIREPRGGTNQGEGLGDVQESLDMARYQLSDQANRLTSLLDQWSRKGTQISRNAGAQTSPDAQSTAEQPKTPLRLLQELTHITEVLSRWKNDPLQREPVEKARARVEDQLRSRGNETIAALLDFFPTVVDLLPQEAGPTWMQSRLLSHVVDQIDTDEAVEFARTVFENPMINSGVRLKAAEVAMKKYKDEVTAALVDLLAHPDPAFNRPNQIVLYFQKTKDPAAIPALVEIAKNLGADRSLRRFTLDALGRFHDPRVVDVLKKVASDPANVDLRGVAVNSLNEILGKDVLGFAHHLMGQLAANDPLMNLLKNIEEMWQESNS